MSNVNICNPFAWLLVITCALLSTATAPTVHAGEDLPRLNPTVAAPPDVLEPLQDYIKVSRTQLAKLDKIIASDNKGDVRGWSAACKTAQKELNKAWAEAMGVWSDKYADDRDRFPKAYQEWHRNEVATWGRLASKGQQLATLHDALVKGIDQALRQTYKIHGVQNTLDSWSEDVEEVFWKSTEVLLKSQSGELKQLMELLTQLQVSYKDLSSIGPINRSFVKFKLRHGREMTNAIKEMELNAYGKQRQTIVSLDLASSSGEFRKHEDRWDKRISELAEEWEDVLEEYKEDAAPILARSVSWRGIGQTTVSDLEKKRKELQDKLQGAIKQLEAKADLQDDG